DPQQRLLLETTWETLENAGYSKETLTNRKIGIFLGIEKQDYLQIINESGCPIDGYINTGNAHSILVNRVSYFFNWKGPSLAINTACSGSFAAIDEAIKSIQSGQVEMALAGGVNVLLNPGLFIINRKMGMFTGEDHIKPFDQEASGHLCGEGLGLILLKRLSGAVKDQDIIYGVIKGISLQHGGKGLFLTAPNAISHQQIIQEALYKSKLQTEDIDYIEAQGTGDPLTDRMELKTYHRVFSKVPSKQIKIGTIKGHTGHLGAASGVIAIIKAILSLKNNQLIRVRNCKNLNWDSQEEPFACKVLEENIPWPAKSYNGQPLPRRIGIHNFGYGGVNGHMILEEYLSSPLVNFSLKTEEQIIPLCARTKEQVITLAERLLHYINTQEYRYYGFLTISLPELAYTLQIGREAMDVRVAFVVKDLPSLIGALEDFIQGKKNIADCYQGDIKQDKGILSVLQYDNDFQICLQRWINKGSLDKLAQLWVKGLSLDWELLHSTNKPRRVSLPTYPFTRQRYWVKSSIINHTLADNSNSRSGAREFLHPLVQENTSDFAEQRFSSIFTGEEFFLADHIVQGQKVLPGVAYLEMAQIAVKRVAGSLEEYRCNGLPPIIRLKNIVWAHPITVNQVKEVHIRLFAQENNQIHYEIYTNYENVEIPLVHCQGIATFHCAEKVPVLDLSELQAKIDQSTFSAEQCYRAFKIMDIDYGYRQQGIKTIYAGNNQVLAKLSLPSAILDTLDQFTLHPSLMDSALQASIGLIMTTSHTSLALFVPFALEELEIIEKCPASMWAWIRTSDDSYAENRIQKLDIDLCDLAGKICVKMKGFSSRILKNKTIPIEKFMPTIPEEKHIHPLLHKNTSTAEELRFNSIFTGQEFFLKDHGGVLPGIVYLEMARAAGEFINGYEIIGLKNVVWGKPILVTEKVQEVCLRLCREDNYYTYKVNIFDEADKKIENTIYSQGRLILGSKDEKADPGSLSIQNIQSRCKFHQGSKEISILIEQIFGTSVIGESFQALEYLQYNDEEALATLQLPACIENGSETYVLHPSLINSAFEAIEIWYRLQNKEMAIRLPFTLLELWIYEKLSKRGYAYIKLSSGQDSQASVKKYDIAITNERGEIVISFHEFTMVESQRKKEQESIFLADKYQNGRKVGSVHQELVKLVSHLQKIAPEMIDLETDLLKYGFDSMGFVSFMNQLNKIYRLELMPTVFFEYPNLHYLGNYLSEIIAKGTVDKASKKPIKRKDFVSFSQREFNHSIDIEAINVNQLSFTDVFLDIYKQALSKCKKLEISFIKTSRNLNIEVFVAGRGVPIVLMPPFGCLATVWMQQIKTLSNNYQIIVCHYPGHGRSEFKLQSSNFAGISEDIFEILDHLNISQPVHLVGWSMGGLISQIMTRNRPDRIQSLTLINTSAKLADEGTMNKNIHQVLESLMSDY
ncbi:MAG: alpha/beta fold hydrolase, partial [Acidobacteriota bacterium]